MVEGGGVKVAYKRCAYCGSFFIPDPRVADHQKACSLGCQRLGKREDNWLYRRRNLMYWENHYEDYVRPWRQRHPEYHRQWRARRS